MKILVLYAGLGGTMNLVDDTEHEITNIELNEDIAKVLQDRKPNQVVLVEDAHEFLRLNADQFDFIQSSPPCQSHTAMMKFTRHKLKRYPDLKLYEEIIFLQNFYKGLWYVENVRPYYDPLIKPTATISRHIFWSNFTIPEMIAPASPKSMINEATVSGKKLMMDWLGIHYEKNIYYDGNHCPAQVLRNCMHPLIGEHIFKSAINA